MALNLNSKKQIVEEVAAEVAESVSMVAAEYRGLTVDQMTQLRANAREANVAVRVVKNTLAKRAVEGTQFEHMAEAMTGPVVLFFAKEFQNSAARVCKDFARENNALVVKGLSIGEEFLDATQLDMVSRIPTRDEAISMLMAVMKAPVGKLARTLAAVRDQKEAA